MDPEQTRRAAFALACRVCGDRGQAEAIAERALARSAEDVAELMRAVRDEARALRPHGVAFGETRRPGALAELDDAHWQLLDLVAQQGATIAEAADHVGVSPREALRLLHQAMRGASSLLAPIAVAG